MDLLKHKGLQRPKDQIYTVYQGKINASPFHTFFFINETKNSNKRNTCFSAKIGNLIKFTLSCTEKTMASLSFPTVCLLVLAGCAAYVTANGYGQSAYSYARPQIYAPARPSFGYAGTGVGGGLSGGLGLNSDLGGILPILLICKLAT